MNICLGNMPMSAKKPSKAQVLPIPIANAEVEKVEVWLSFYHLLSFFLNGAQKAEDDTVALCSTEKMDGSTKYTVPFSASRAREDEVSEGEVGDEHYPQNGDPIGSTHV